MPGPGIYLNFRILILFLIALLCYPAAAQPQPIIDMHLHAFGYDQYGFPPPPNEISGNIPAAGSDAEAIKAALAAMTRHNIVLALASGPLDQVLKWKEADPRRIIGGAYCGPRDELPKISRLRQLFQSDSLGFLGELGLQYRGMAAGDSAMTAYFALAEELDIPVGIHTGLSDTGTPYGCCPKFRVSLGNPLLIEEVLVRHPKLPIYLMHGGYPFLQETKGLLTIYPQLYVDIAVLNWAVPREEFHEYLKSLLRAGFGKRIMFGSDQMIWPEAIGMAIEGVESAAFLTQAQKRDIFYNNAARFLQLSEKEIARHHGQ